MMDQLVSQVFWYLLLITAGIIVVVTVIGSCCYFICQCVSSISKTRENPKSVRRTRQRKNGDQGEKRSARTSNDLLEPKMKCNLLTRSGENYTANYGHGKAPYTRWQTSLWYGPSMPTIYETEEEHQINSDDHTRQAMPGDPVIIIVDNHSVHFALIIALIILITWYIITTRKRFGGNRLSSGDGNIESGRQNEGRTYCEAEQFLRHYTEHERHRNDMRERRRREWR